MMASNPCQVSADSQPDTLYGGGRGDIVEHVPRFLSQASCHSVIEQIHALGLAQGRVNLLSRWRGDIRWGRNRVTMARDWRNNTASFESGEATMLNQIDSASLRAMAQTVWRDRQAFPERFPERDPRVTSKPFVVLSPTQEYPRTHIWSERTYRQTPDERAAAAVQLISGADRAGMLSSGYLSVEARGTALYTEDGLLLYAPQTLAQCSMTVRDSQGTASGWAGASSYDWSRFDADKLAKVALDKCLHSRNPVKIEPGRYTLIMEPQATFDLVRQFLTDALDRRSTEVGLMNTFKAGRIIHSQGGEGDYDVTRIGERVLDERISITFDPTDPDLGVLPFDNEYGDPYVPVTWFDKGVLTNMSYSRAYALRVLQAPTGQPNSGAFRMSGGTMTIEEMIATTKRGLLVTRFWGVEVVHPASMLCVGLTRDGLWLVENGEVVHPVVNMRFTESPLFAFNQVEQLGVPVPVFNPETPAIVPPVKVRDFSFTALVDAV